MADRQMSDVMGPLARAHREHYAFLRRRLALLGVPEDALEDAAQDVFVVLVRRVREYDPRYGIRQWMSGVARRVARRYRDARGSSVPALDPDDVAADVTSPEDLATLKEARVVLDDFLGSLDREKWEVFVFAEIEGLPGVEIAAELQLNLNTVYARLRAARSAFAAAVKRHRAREQRRGAWLLAPLERLKPWSNPSPIALAGFISLRAVVTLAIVTLLGVLVWWTAGTREAVHGPEAPQMHEAREPSLGSAAFGERDRYVSVVARAIVNGVVRDTNGNAISGATVCAHTRAADVATSVRREPLCATSGPRGHYELAGLHPIDYRISASARDHTPSLFTDAEAPKSRRDAIRLHAGETRGGADIVLGPGGVAVRGAVRDLAGGPIAGAMVRVHAGLSADAALFSGCVTDDDGMFECWSSPGGAFVVASADGYTEVWERGVAPGQPRELFLTPAATIVGKVVLAKTGAPVPGATVTARLKDRLYLSPSIAHASADEDGSFRITGLEPGTYKVEVTTPELFGLSREAVHVGLAETSAPIVVEAHAAFSVEGSVVVAGREERGCPSGSVHLEDAEQHRGGSAEIEPDGSVLVRALQPGMYEVSVRCDGYVSEAEYSRIAIGESSLAGLSWTVTAGLSIRGVVVEADGAGAIGADVVARSQASPRAKRTDASTRSEAGGEFELSGLLPGTYAIEVIGAGGMRQVATEVELDGRDLSGIRIERAGPGPTARIEGTTRDRRGAPVAGVWVGAVAERGPYSRTQSGEDGTYALEVSVGAVRVRAEAEQSAGDDDASGSRVNVDGGETARVDVVVETRAGRIAGRVVDAAGLPIADAFVDVEGESHGAGVQGGDARRKMTSRARRQRAVLTDVDGRFEKGGLGEGSYTVRAFRQGGGEGVVEGVAVGTDVNVQIETPGSLSGSVIVDGGAAPDRFSLRATDKGTGVAVQDEFFRTDGQWRVSNLPAGRYEIEIDGGADGIAITEVEIAAGEEKSGIELALAGTVALSGTIVDLESGDPVAGMRVSVGARSGGVPFGVPASGERKEISDAAGRFEIARAPIGAVRVAVWTDGSVTGPEYNVTYVPVVIAESGAAVVLEPIALVRKRVRNGEAVGSLGLTIEQPAADEAAEDRRHVVAFVRPGGAADAAGIFRGHEIVAVDGHDVRGSRAYRYRLLTLAAPGWETSFTLGDERVVSVTLGPPD